MWVVVVTAGVMVFGTVFVEAGSALRPIAFFVAWVIAAAGWFTDVLEAPRGRVSSVRARPPRRRRATPKGSATRRRR